MARRPASEAASSARRSASAVSRSKPSIRSGSASRAGASAPPASAARSASPGLVALGARLLDAGRGRERTPGRERRETRRRVGDLLLDRLALSRGDASRLLRGVERLLEPGDVLVARQGSARQRIEVGDGRVEPRQPFGQPARFVGEVLAILSEFPGALGYLAERRKGLAGSRRIGRGRAGLAVATQRLDRLLLPRVSKRLRPGVRLHLPPLGDQRAQRRERRGGRPSLLERLGARQAERARVTLERLGVVIGLGLHARAGRVSRWRSLRCA